MGGGLREDREFEDLSGAVARLEAQLNASRKFADELNRALYEQMRADLRKARRRARRAEAELAAVRASTTFRVGRAVGAVPARVRRRLRPGRES